VLSKGDLHSIGYQRGRLVVEPAKPDLGERQVHYFQPRVLQALADDN